MLKYAQEKDSAQEGEDPDEVALDRGDIERELHSGDSVFILESTASWQSHCRARFCLPRELRGRPNIESEYRLNLKDIAGKRTFYKPPNYFYHVSCVEQILDLSALLAPKQLQHDWGMKLRSGLFGVITCYYPVHMAIDDWFENAGLSFDLDVYTDHKEAYRRWEMLTQFRAMDHVRHIQDGNNECSCDPEPERPIYSTKERTPRLLSEVLASIEEVEQIDDIPKEWLEILAEPEYETENEESSADVAKDKESVDDTDGQKPRKATDLEMKERRKELVDYIKELKAEIEKSRLDDKDHQDAKKDEFNLRDQSAVEPDATEKDIAKGVAEDITDKESGKEVPKTAQGFQSMSN
ncbi:hypothetical protein N431DRAFT_496510 [Stipitochalara longipes BDJ]|nr:hypothetical protein N431DRAFT_496510 [Stipitochalara longipes BDJ]